MHIVSKRRFFRCPRRAYTILFSTIHLRYPRLSGCRRRIFFRVPTALQNCPPDRVCSSGTLPAGASCRLFGNSHNADICLKSVRRAIRYLCRQSRHNPAWWQPTGQGWKQIADPDCPDGSGPLAKGYWCRFSRYIRGGC